MKAILSKILVRRSESRATSTERRSIPEVTHY
jgi:hypothetical protein